MPYLTWLATFREVKYLHVHIACLSTEDVRRAKEAIEVLSSLTGSTSSISAAAAGPGRLLSR